ncbi:MAG: hypothetical protein ABI310_02450 [Microbacteriaceae bacterium]
MRTAREIKTETADVDDYDLSSEKTACPEINNVWWPHSIPTDAPTK